jgi:hypothetical protein
MDVQIVFLSTTSSMDAQGTVRLSSFVQFLYPASGQSGTGMKNNADDGTSPVPEQGDPVLYRNAPVQDCDVGCRHADADAELCKNTHKYVGKVFCTKLFKACLML